MIAINNNLNTKGPAQPQVKRNTWDGRLFLKVKLKSLAEESRIIRKEEKRNVGFRNALRTHRVGIVRSESRATLLAYGFLRGLHYRQIENGSKGSPDWKKVEAMVKKYGAIHRWEGVDWGQREKLNAETIARFQAWKKDLTVSK
jgi:hypothetical protein